LNIQTFKCRLSTSNNAMKYYTENCTIISVVLNMASTSGGSATCGSSASLISESQNEEIVEDDQETEESETNRKHFCEQ